ncbi:MAG: A/G-specific adenine glycosylase [Catalinimonas sp.]
MLPPFADRLIRWYEHHRRDLPWRKTRDPYKIWLSEIILQQTRVAQGLSYYQRFVEHFPDVHALAAATEEEVLNLWQGLGYYSRARNLHYTAKEVAGRGGVFPPDAAGLRELKGVGPYTAAAIAGFAYGEAVPVVDGNVYRVLARHRGIEVDIASPAAYRTFEAAARCLLPPEHPAAFNQAIMELGARQCVPLDPKCLFCPVQDDCHAFATGQQSRLPIKSAKKPPRPRYLHYLVPQDPDGGLWLRRRTGRGIWQGLYDFPLEEADRPLDEATLRDRPTVRTLREAGAEWAALSPRYEHILTHQRLFVHFHDFTAPVALIRATFPELTRATPPHWDDYPVPVLIRKYLNDR